MRKTAIILLLIGSALIILDSFNFAHSLALFLLAGIIPGTDISISAIDMMAAFATAFTIVVLRLTIWPQIKHSFFSSKKASVSKKAVKQN